jgi:hypothetical protein
MGVLGWGKPSNEGMQLKNGFGRAARGLLAGLVSLVLAQHGFGVEWEPDKAYERLVKANVFAFGGVGFAGTTSDGEKAFHVVLASTNGLEVLKKVLKDGTREAQMYALCGLRKLAPKDYQAEAERIGAEKATVKMMTGCLMFEEPVAKVVEGILSGAYDGSVSRGQRRL